MKEEIKGRIVKLMHSAFMDIQVSRNSNISTMPDSVAYIMPKVATCTEPRAPIDSFRAVEYRAIDFRLSMELLIKDSAFYWLAYDPDIRHAIEVRRIQQGHVHDVPSRRQPHRFPGDAAKQSGIKEVVAALQRELERK